MKALIVGPAYPLRGGIANFSHSLGKAFKAEGWAVSVVSFSLQYPSILFPGKTQKEVSGHPPDLEIHALINSVNPRTWQRAARFIRDAHPDIVVVQYWTPYLAPALAGILRKLRKMIHIQVIGLTHNIAPHEGSPLDRHLTRRFLKQCDGFITLSESVRKELKTLYPDKPASFIPHPVYDLFGDPVERKAGLEKLGLDPGFTYLLFFGIIRPYKGLDLFIEAMALLREQYPRLRMLVAGEFYENPARYTRLIEQYGLSGRVKMFDYFIPTDEVKYFFAAADLVVQPYRSASQSGITQMAYQFGTPMVVTRVGGLPELVRDGVTGWVCDPEPQAVAGAITKFLQHQDRESLRKNVLAGKKRFGWDRMVREIRNMGSALSG